MLKSGCSCVYFERLSKEGGRGAPFVEASREEDQPRNTDRDGDRVGKSVRNRCANLMCTRLCLVLPFLIIRLCIVDSSKRR